MAYDRITDHDLKIRVEWLNKKLNRPATRGHYDESNRWQDHTGHIFIDSYSPGDNPSHYKLAEINPPDHRGDVGIHEWTNHRMTRREFYVYLNGMLDVLDVLGRMRRESTLAAVFESV